MTVMESLKRTLQELPAEERDELGGTFIRVIQLLESSSEPLPEEDRRAWFQQLSQTFEGFAHLVVYGQTGSGKSHSMVDRVFVVGGPDTGEPSLAELEKANKTHRFEQWRQAIRESFSTGELEERFGVSRQQLEQLRKRRKLLGLQPPFERGFVYPVWEFGEDARPHELIPALLEAAEEAQLDPLSLHRLMVSETATPRGPLMLALKAGEDDDVLEVVRAAGAQGS
jgi:hypothetical protein